MSEEQFLPSFEGTWARLSQVAVKGAQYNSRERQPHPKCLEGTRVNLLKYIHQLLDEEKKNQLIWLRGTAGVGKSAVAFTVAERMQGLKVTEETNVEKRLAGTFFFSRKYTKRCTAGYFFATLAYQLANNFPSIRKDVNRVIRDNPALLDPDTPLRDQMEALFLKPLRLLRSRLRECLPLTFVIDALDECTSEPELIDLILSLARALRDPDLPVTHVLLTNRSEPHICKAFHNDEVQPLLCEIPVKTSGEGVAAIISLDGADVDTDIYIFLQHSFAELASRHPDFPQPTKDELAQLASRAGRRFIVASTMVKFIIDDEDKDPHDRLQLMLRLTSELLAGTEVYKLYDRILSTCADPKRAYMHLSIVTALADPLPVSQISTLLGPGLGRDVQTTLIQLRSVMDIPTDSTLPVNIYHSSIRDYVSDPSNCSLPQVREHNMPSPHSLLADSSFHLMMKNIPETTALLDALSELEKQSQAMQAEDPHRLRVSLSFLVQPPAPLSVLICMLWLRGDRTSDLQYWPQTKAGREWVQTKAGQGWLRTEAGREWLQTEAGREWLQTLAGREWLRTEAGREWLQTEAGREWLQTEAGRGWLQTEAGREWLRTRAGREWLRTRAGRGWLQTEAGPGWLRTEAGRGWLQTEAGRGWLQTEAGRSWLQTLGGRNWLQTPHGQAWQSTPAGSVWATMEEFSSTLEAISNYTIVPELALLPTFKVVRQFKSLPDFLMFLTFLALTPRNHFTSASPEVPDREIIRAMNLFIAFANEAQERSRSSSDALKYASQHWVVHLSRAPNPWDDALNHTFQAFWNHRLLSWLERQWCLKGLRSCLDILSEGQKLANVIQFEPSMHSLMNSCPSQPSVPIPGTQRKLRPSPRSNATALHVGTSRKRPLDEFPVGSNSALESDTSNSPSKHRK